MNGKEHDILNEFLTEVRYEDKFFLNALRDRVKEFFPQVATLSIWGDRYMDVYGPYNSDPKKKVYFGRIDLKRNLEFYQDKIKNLSLLIDEDGLTDKVISDLVLNFIKNDLKSHYQEGNYLESLNRVTAPGIEAILKKNPFSVGPFSLVIGFTNNEVSLVRETLQNKGYLIFPERFKNWDIERLIRAAYNFKQDEDDFLEGIPYEYKRFYKTEELAHYSHTLTPSEFENKFDKDSAIQEYLKKAFWRIRNLADTQRAIYRLSLLEVIDDYTINYAEKTMTIYFRKKKEKEYRENLQTYLKRYQGDESVNNWLGKADNRIEETLLRNCLFTLTDFVYESIKKKRESAIDYMHKQCELFIQRGEKAFRENILYYFTSKYAATEYLPDDSKDNNSLVTVAKYIGWMENPPAELGIGAQIDNYNHLKGATERVLSSDPENKTALLLRSFANILLETHNKDIDIEAFNSHDFDQALSDYIANFYSFSQTSPYDQWKEKVAQFNRQLVSINSQLSPLVENLTQRVDAQHWNTWLGSFMNDFADIEQF